MIASRKEFLSGFGLFVAFLVVLIILFFPIFKGQNALRYLDNLYNSISKGSAYYIPAVQEQVGKFAGESIIVTLKAANQKAAEQIAALFRSSDAEVIVTGTELKVKGDLGKILGNCLKDADAMYKNAGEQVSGKYGYDERRVLFNWWTAFKGMDKDLSGQKKFKEAKIVNLVQNKAVETSYNYYKVEAQKISDQPGTVIASLLFYVIYTLWYGFAILFMFEGWGLRLGH